MLPTTQRDAQARLQALVGHKLNLVILLGQSGLQLLLDGHGVLDQNKVGYTLIYLKARLIAKGVLIQLATPLHLIGHVAIMLIAVERGKGHGLGEAVVTQLLVDIADEVAMTCTDKAKAAAQAR